MSKERSKKKGKEGKGKGKGILEIVMAQDPGQRNDALNPSNLYMPSIAPMYRADLQNTLGAVLGCALGRAPQKRDTHVRLLAFPAGSAAGRLSLRNDWEWQWERGWYRLERRNWYR